MNLNESLKLEPEQLRWLCPEDIFQFKSSAEVAPLEKIVGQTRAIEAIKLGAELKAKGYNIFVTGLSGTGRTSTVKKILDANAITCPIVYDYCYVHNFRNSDSPTLIKLSKGQGKVFNDAMNDVVSYLRIQLPKLFEDESYQQSRKKIIESFQNKEREVLSQFDSKIKPFGFVRGQLENEQGNILPEVFPMIDGKPIQIEQLSELVEKEIISEEKATELRLHWQQFHDEIYDLARIGMKLMQDFRRDLLENDKASASIIVNSAFNNISNEFAYDKVFDYINEVKNYILDNLNIFVQDSIQTGKQVDDSEGEIPLSERFQVFKVNVILDNSETTTAPIVIETNPTYTNLFGTIEKVYDQKGFWKTDFTKIKSGSLLRADQGFLIVNANDLFQEPGVWQALKRVLLYDKLEIQPFDSYFQISQSHLKPEAVNVSVKVIIIGGQTLYKLLYHYEKGFKKIFKVNAQFDYEAKLSNEMLLNYAGFISMLCTKEGLPHCSPDGVAAVVEWAVEQAGSKEKVILKFSDVADLLREAAFYYREGNSNLISRKDVEKTIEARKYRNNLLDEKLSEHIIDNTILIDTIGEKVGQINGLTVYNDSIYSFGKPAKITATISAGNAGIINIEREADLSGKIHNKGMLILTGFLRERFAQKHPLSLSASIAFEQSYGGIDGDSATAAEIYVLLSAISGMPINQSLAITGSVNQKGDIQPIGGVNEKITGFYEICKARGFNGSNGVVIPKQNIKDLMLNKEIVESCKNGEFSVYAIGKIEDGVGLFFGIEAGTPDKNGNYPSTSLFGKVSIRLKKLVDLNKKTKASNSKTKKDVI